MREKRVIIIVQWLSVCENTINYKMQLIMPSFYFKHNRNMKSLFYNLSSQLDLLELNIINNASVKQQIPLSSISRFTLNNLLIQFLTRRIIFHLN